MCQREVEGVGGKGGEPRENLPWLHPRYVPVLNCQNKVSSSLLDYDTGGRGKRGEKTTQMKLHAYLFQLLLAIVQSL